VTSDDHRQTAADWHRGDQSTALYAYATTGAVRAGLIGEVGDLLAFVERSAVDVGFDRVGEHHRLHALLHHVEAERAVQRAYQVGREHGLRDAAQWRDALADQPIADATATAQRVLEVIEDDDVAALDIGPYPEDNVTPSEVVELAGMPEPEADDIEAYKRWAAAQPDICGAYLAAFVNAFWDAVAEACCNNLAEIAPTPGRQRPDDQWPYIRPVAAPTGVAPDPGTRVAPPDWIARPIGSWEGVASEIVYDPRRFEVDVLVAEHTPATTIGWPIRTPDGSRALWITDRVATCRATLDQLDQEAAGLDATGSAHAPEPPAQGIEL
jgi:hypothetical protein